MIQENTNRIHSDCLLVGDCLDGLGDILLATEDTEGTGSIVGGSCGDDGDGYGFLVGTRQHSIYHLVKGTVTTDGNKGGVLVHFAVED